jgi:hypothetical protein
LPGPFPIADTHNSIRSHANAKLAALKLAILQFLEPGVLPVLAMALIVGGWSYGLKLSHYVHHSKVTKASTTRMWLDQRNEATAAAPVPQRQVEHKFVTPQLWVLSVPQQQPKLLHEEIIAEYASVRINAFVSPLHLLRAPPLSPSRA